MKRKSEQLTFKSMRDEVLSDNLCTKCGKHIRTIRRVSNWIDSEYIDAEGRCWDCVKKK